MIGRIVTFYSWKGGVGRTMAVANTGVQLARRGKRVLLVDWDLEAPGLDKYFLPYNATNMPEVVIREAKDSSGLLGLLVRTMNALPRSCEASEWQKRCMAISVPDLPGRSRLAETFQTPEPLHLLGSGMGGSDYAKLLQSFSWPSFFEKEGGQWLEVLRQQWRDEYDFVLIDSRTGLTDSGGVCTVQMPDILVMVFTANQQSLTDGLDFIRGVQRSRATFAYERAPLTVVPLLARWEGDKEVDLADTWLERIQELIMPLVDVWFPSEVPVRRMLERLRVPHVARFSFGEPLPVLTHSLSDPDRPGLAYDLLAELLANRFLNAGQTIAPEYKSSFVPADPTKDRIYISYRRDDARGSSGRVWDWLRIGFGRERVFRDVASIGAGKWRDKIDQALAASTACVVVIGRRWADHTNLSRLQDPTDMVRYELETALAGGERQELTMVPLLVEGSSLHDIPFNELPESLQPLLSDWNLLELSESNWDDDIRRLIEAIAAATGLPVQPDLKEWLSLMAGDELGLAALVPSKDSSPASIAQRQEVLGSLLRKVATASYADRSGLKEGLQALAAGNTRLAEEVFEREVHEVERSMAASELMAYEQQLIIVRARTELVPANTQWKRELSLIHSKKGDLLVAQTDFPAALSAYRQSMEIQEALAQQDPANTQWQHDLSVSHYKIGDVLVALGNGSAALSAYRQSMEIQEALAQQDPAPCVRKDVHPV